MKNFPLLLLCTLLSTFFFTCQDDDDGPLHADGISHKFRRVPCTAAHFRARPQVQKVGFEEQGLRHGR